MTKKSKLGFIGTGTITKAIVTGLIRFDGPFDEIFLSPRNAQVSTELSALDPRVHVCANNQEVLDRCDVVCLAFLPQVAKEVLAALHFSQQHHVISFLAGVSLAEIGKQVGQAAKIVRAIPLPPVAQAKGSTAICPEDRIAHDLFAPLGETAEVQDESRFEALSAITATMASFYALLESSASWLAGQGLPYEDARAYLSGIYTGLAHDLTCTSLGFDAMAKSCMTPGGLNEQVHNELAARGTYTHFSDALDRILQRIKGSA